MQIDKKIKSRIFLGVAIILLYDCTFQKRLYRKGFYVEKLNHKPTNNSLAHQHEKENQQENKVEEHVYISPIKISELKNHFNKEPNIVAQLSLKSQKEAKNLTYELSSYHFNKNDNITNQVILKNFEDDNAKDKNKTKKVNLYVIIGFIVLSLLLNLFLYYPFSGISFWTVIAFIGSILLVLGFVYLISEVFMYFFSKKNNSTNVQTTQEQITNNKKKETSNVWRTKWFSLMVYFITLGLSIFFYYRFFWNPIHIFDIMWSNGCLPTLTFIIALPLAIILIFDFVKESKQLKNTEDAQIKKDLKRVHIIKLIMLTTSLILLIAPLIILLLLK